MLPFVPLVPFVPLFPGPPRDASRSQYVTFGGSWFECACLQRYDEPSAVTTSPAP
ncbi:MAG: hypothetical protein QM811_16870 [Pirellulales bacterium]